MAVQIIEHIEKTPGMLSGRARVAGRRIPVWQIVVLYDQQNVPAREIADMYNLTLAQVFAALAYYHDHKSEIDAEIAEAKHIESGAQKSEWQRRLEEKTGLRHRRETEDREMTTAEIAETYGITDATVRQTILRGGVPARKSGAIWLVRASDAEAQWGHRQKRKAV